MALLFLLKLTLCWGFFALLYTLLLRGETFFRANRAYLLGTIALGILLSLDVSWFFEVPVDIAPFIMLPTFTVGLQQTEEITQQWRVGDYLWLTYLLGVGFMLLRLGWAIICLVRMAVHGTAEVLPDGCMLLRSDATSVPFSFFKWIFVPIDFQADSHNRAIDTDAMLTHERAHAHGWHSADVLAMELLCAAFWFHPLVHWYRRALRNVHEYLADAEASRRVNLKQYGLLLIQQSQPGMPIALVHHFFQSPLKQRLIMLTKKASNPTKTLKYGLLLPITFLFVLLFRQAPALAQTVEADHLQYVHSVEATNWIAIDTVVTFDPENYQETVSVVRKDLAPYKEKRSGRQIYQICEKLPEFPGGQDALFQFLIANLHYPPQLSKAKVEGMAVMRFIVAADGSIRSIIEKPDANPVAPEFIEESKRVIALMPNWIPGEQKGEKVDCEMVLPIKYKLDK